MGHGNWPIWMKRRWLSPYCTNGGESSADHRGFYEDTNWCQVERVGTRGRADNHNFLIRKGNSLGKWLVATCDNLTHILVAAKSWREHKCSLYLDTLCRLLWCIVYYKRGASMLFTRQELHTNSQGGDHENLTIARHFAIVVSKLYHWHSLYNVLNIFSLIVRSKCCSSKYCMSGHSGFLTYIR